MSPSAASWRAKSGSFFSSPGWKRRFSNSAISPGWSAATTRSASGPTQSDAKCTVRPPEARDSGSTSGRSDCKGSGPFGRPKCDITTGLPPRSMMAARVGASRSIRVASVNLPSLTGTFRSARTRTRLPATLRSSSVWKRGIGEAPLRVGGAFYRCALPHCKCAVRPYLKPAMANTLEKLAFEATQAARIGWFFGHKALVARLTKPAPAPHLHGRPMPDRQKLIADLWRLVERDWHNIEAGIYAPPEDGRGNPFDGLRRAADFFADLRAVETRRHGGAADVLLRDKEAERYPRYYRRMFHFQSDGYLSEASAERYDYQVEVLFGGGASLMRRQALVPLRAALRRHSGGSHFGGSGTARLLDIGCGTGSFLREVKRNFPRLAVTGLDLSEPYLRVARRRLADWSRVTLIPGAAEAIPVPDGEFEIISCIYLFHELP